MSAPGDGAVRRVRARHIDWVRERLSARDWAVITVFEHVRLVSGRHFDQLCFHDLGGRSRTVVRGRVLHRLVRWRVLQTLDRRVGGSAGGSAAATFCLDSVGEVLLVERLGGSRGRQATVPGVRFIAHSLAITDVYAGLAAAAGRGWQLDNFQAEPGCWWPDGLTGQLKPDAYLVLSRPGARDHWWLEVDRGTESLPTLRRKLTSYLAFVDRGQLGPDGVVPRVLVTVLTPARLAAVRDLINSLPAPAEQLLMVALHDAAALSLLSLLRE